MANNSSTTGESDNVVSARDATDHDAAVIEALAAMGRTEALPERGGEMLLVHDKADEAFVELLQRHADPQHLVVVGQIDDVVVGYGLAQTQVLGGIHSAMIHELFVHPDARMVGVAASMLQHVIAWAVDGGCDVIESHVLPGNRAAKNFFERVGMVTRKMQVSARLAK